MQIIKLSQLKEKVKSVKLERRKIATVVMIVLTVLLFAATVWGLFSVQRIRRVIIKGECPYSSDDILDAAEVDYDDFLFSTDKEEMKTKILEELPYIREVKIRRGFGRMVIKVESDTAYYYMKLKENSNDAFLLSKDLRVIDYKSSIESLKDSSLIYIELPYMDIETCVLGKHLEYAAEEKNGYVTEMLEYFHAKDYSDAITSIGLKSKFEGGYVDFYGKCRIVFGKPDMNVIDTRMRLAYDILNAKQVDGDYIGYIKIDVSDGKTAIVNEPEKLD